MTDSLRRLLELEKTGKYVFHGSVDDIDVLEPRQAYNFVNGIREEDGEPAVFATPFVNIAIFRSLINSSNCKGESRSRFGTNNGLLNFSATENLLESATNITGKIYVLDKDKFNDFIGMQCRCKETIRPFEIIEVKFEDLPQNIEIILP